METANTIGIESLSNIKEQGNVEVSMDTFVPGSSMEKYCGIEAVWEAFEHVDDTPYGEL